MRHIHFAVTPTQRDRWLRHMNAAIDTLDLSAIDDHQMRAYMTHAADFMVNAPDPG